MTPAGIGHDGQARVNPAFAQRVLSRIHGLTVPDALHILRFTPAFRCPQVARVVEIAAADAAHPPGTLLVGESSVSEGEDVVRVRRQAHGTADWITTRTTAITVAVESTVDRLALSYGRCSHDRSIR
jgi:ribosomal protein L22